MEIKDSKILVIGGSGFIGSHVVSELLKTNVKEVLIYDNFSRGKIQNIKKNLEDDRCKIYPNGGDIRDIDLLNDAMNGVDGVIHLAAMWLLHCKDYPRTAFHVNIEGTFNVLEACVRNNIKRLVYSSSASVYGDAVEVPMTEERIILRPCRRKSASFKESPLVSISFVWDFFFELMMSLKIWLIANSPIKTGSSLKPSFNALMPNVSRDWPVAAAMPGIESSMPRNPDSSDFDSDLPPTLAIRTKAIRTSVKYSKGPNLVERVAMGFAKRTRNPHEITPPTKDAITASPSALSGCPF